MTENSMDEKVKSKLVCLYRKHCNYVTLTWNHCLFKVNMCQVFIQIVYSLARQVGGCLAQM